jgi:serine/threonine protein kinase
MYPNTILRGKYTIIQELGRGGMGQVFLGQDASGRDIAIKRLAPELTGDAAVLERFRREGEALKALRHPNIVEFIEMFEDGGQHYIVTEYISGGTLLDRIRNGAMPVEEVRRIALDICDALVRAHKLEIIHRDIKPENVMLTSDHIAKLADFGIARLVNEGSRLTRTGMIVGTPDYLAPEIWAGQTPDAQTDLWSLGVVLFEMMSGQVPFEGGSLVTIMRSITSATIPNLRLLHPGLPEGMVQIVERLLDRDRSRRYATSRQLAADLEAGQPTGASGAGGVSTGAFANQQFGMGIREDGTRMHEIPPVPTPSVAVVQPRNSPVPHSPTADCMYCGTKNDLNAMFCGSCGRSLLVDCPSCGRLVNGSLSSCPYCSGEVKEAVKARELADRQPSKPASPGSSVVSPAQITPVRPTVSQTGSGQSWVEDVVAPVTRGGPSIASPEPFHPRQAALREELKAKLNTARIFSSGWWWLAGGFYGIIWIIGYLTSRSALKSVPAFGFSDIEQELKKAKNRARNYLIIAFVLIALWICIVSLSTTYR